MSGQFISDGFIAGSAIALLAVAFQSVYLPTGVFFVGLAGIYTLAPFLALSLLKAGGGWFGAIAGAVLISIVVSIACEVFNHAPLSRRQASQGAQLITSLGIYIVLVQIITMIWGSNTRTLRTGLDSVTILAGVVITQSQWIMLSTSVGLIAVFAGFLFYSEIGLRLRALAENQSQFALFGHNVDHYRLLAFGICGFFAAASALVTTYDTAFDPYIGLQAVLLAVVAVIIGGYGTFAGPVLAAFILGLLRAAVVWNLSPRWQEAVTFALLVIFLLFRPHGLLGEGSRIESAG